MRFFYLTLFLISSSWALPQGDFGIDAGKSSVRFHVVHKFHKVLGKSDKVEARALVTKEKAEVMVRIDAKSFDSGNGNRDAHTKEVIEAHKFPFIILKAKLSDTPEGKVRAEGTLSFHGVERPLKTDVLLTQEGEEWKATFAFPLSLTEYGVERPSLLFVKVDDEVKMEGELWFKK